MAERRRSPQRRTRVAPRQDAAQTTQQHLERWRQRIQHARRLRTDWAAKYHVETLAKTFNGDLESMTDDWSDMDMHLLINRFWPTIKAQIPGLLYQSPKFFVRPSGRRATQVQTQFATASEALLEQIARQDDHLVQEAKLALQQSFWAIGVLKAIYDPQVQPNPQRRQPMYVLDAQGQPVRDPITGELVPLLDPDTQQPMHEPDKILKDEVYRWQWVNWYNMLLPDAGPAMLRWPWVGEEIEMALEEAQDDTRFAGTLRGQLVASRKPRGDGALDQPVQAFGSPHPLDETLWVIECWDLRTHQHVILAEGQPFSATQFLLTEDTPEGIEDHPYAILPGYTPMTDPDPSPWPVPHCWNWLGVQHEYQARREQGMNAARRSARKIFYDQATFPDVDAATEALDSSKDLAAVLVNDTNKLPIPLADPGTTPDITRDLALLEKDWLNITGTPGERIGSTESETATQAVIADRSATLREGEMKNAVTLWLTTSGKKMLQLLKGTLTLEHWVKIRDWTDKELQDWLRGRFGQQASQIGQIPGLRQLIIQQYGKEKWTPVTREQLTFEADVGVVPGSSRSRTQEADRQQALLFMRALAEVAGVMPALLTSRRFVSHFADIFEIGDELLVDEILASVEKHMQLQAQAEAQKQASKGGGAGQVTPAQMQGTPMASRLQTAMMNGGF